MAKDKYGAVWVSHSSLSAFLECPRSYFLKNIYRDPKTGHKVKIMSPPLALGQAVHEVIESLSEIKTEDRFREPLLSKFERAWGKISGKGGGFLDKETEFKYKTRGQEMIKRVIDNPGPIKELAVKINMDLPHYWLSEEDNIVLCGKIDWLKYIPERDAVEIIDFKTSKNEEGDDSLQLPIYNLLVHNCQKRKVEGAWYWYLGISDKLTQKKLPNLQESEENVLKIAKKVKLARQMNRFLCPEGESGCRACKPLEAIIKGGGEFVGHDEYHADVYILNKTETEEDESTVL